MLLLCAVHLLGWWDCCSFLHSSEVTTIILKICTLLHVTCLAVTTPYLNRDSCMCWLPSGFDPLDAHTSALLAALVVGVAVQEAMRVGAWVMHRCSSHLCEFADGAVAQAMLCAPTGIGSALFYPNGVSNALKRCWCA